MSIEYSRSELKLVSDILFTYCGENGYLPSFPLTWTNYSSHMQNSYLKKSLFGSTKIIINNHGDIFILLDVCEI